VEVFGIPRSWVMDISEGDPSIGLGVVSSMIIGSFDCSWGLPTLIRVLLLALKYMEVYLFQFPFCFGGIFKAESTVATSLANISSDFPLCCSISMLPVEVSVSTVYAYIAAISGSISTFCFGVTVVAVPTFGWDVSTFSALLCSLFSLGVCAVVPCSVLGSAIWPFPSFSFCLAYAFLSCVSLELVFSLASMCSPSSLLDEVSSSARILISSSLDMFRKISQGRGTL